MAGRALYINEQLSQVDGHPPKNRIAKHVKMATDPFVFFRGSSQLFYADIKMGVLRIPQAFMAIPDTAIMGDCHLSNFGFLTEEGSHGDQVIFAPNDFDDACIGPAVWDISRFAVSLALAAGYGQKVVTGQMPSDEKNIGKKAATEDDAKEAIAAFFDAYTRCCKESIASTSITNQALEQFDPKHILFKPWQKALRRSADGDDFLTKSRLAKAVDWTDTHISFKNDPEKFQPLDEDLYGEIAHHFAPYVDDHILDITARLGSGTGSLNLSRFYLLVGPRDFSGEQDLALCHIVEVKQQRKAAPLYHFEDISPVNRLNPAHLTIQCQRRMQRNPDLVLDEVLWRDAYWLTRSRHHAKVGIDPEDAVVGKKATEKGGFVQYATCCGKALALAHCRGDRRSTRFEQKIVEAMKKGQEQLLQSCLAYTEQVKADTQHLRQLIAQ